ncbi:2-alkenal reductase (NADP(+)-dependent) [Hevea brasiliensis]|uniref:2-alkenal reductase (NADP(+)-dependent) n=1 Tax=Hevea brasiliensis TaxID=3981 RepID=UPI0025D54AC2|nr:2-alkenal reductase (NADP(+)-dependent) [Hevea brasiliensis]
MAGENEVVSNEQVIFKNYVSGFPADSDMYLITACTKLNVPEGSKAILVKNLYLSCDPYLRGKMRSLPSEDPNFASYRLGSVILGVAKVEDSGHPDMKKGDLVWGLTNWEEYSLIIAPESFFKVFHTDVPLSYYTGLLGMPGMIAYFGFCNICSR